MTLLYRDFETQDQIDAQYDIRRSVEDPAPFRAFFQQKNEEALGLPDVRLGVAYGSGSEETLDIYPAVTPGAPVLVFIHGGYWRASSAREHAYVALGPHALGVTVVVTDYSLCPDVPIDTITRQNHAAVAWTQEHAPQFGADPERVVLAGHSAGGQQVARLLGAPGLSLLGGIGLSGIYDLRPLRHSFLQPKLRLNDALVVQESPLFQVPQAAPPLSLLVGSEESDEFTRQSRTLFDAWKEAGLRVDLLEQPGLNHYTSVAQWTDAESPACAILTKMLE